jgi:hypothetical protein
VSAPVVELVRNVMSPAWDARYRKRPEASRVTKNGLVFWAKGDPETEVRVPEEST